MSNFAEDLSDSAFDFLRVVYPKLIELKFIEGEIIPIESNVAERLMRQFDILAGIDIWQLQTGKGIRGIANRIQWCQKAWNTFTIRKLRVSGTETEYEKRKRAMQDEGWLYPYFTIQSYITERRKGDLIALAIAKTEDILYMIEQKYCWENINPQDGNTFICVSWDKMHEMGYSIKTYIKV